MAAPRKYSEELRDRAVRLVFETGRPIAHVARDLGVHKEALRTWVRQARADSGERRDLLTSDVREELKRLRKGERGASARERDPEGRFRLFRDGARPDPATVTRYVEERRDAFGVEPICRVLGVPVSTHYARRSRVPSRRELRDRELLVAIEAARTGYRHAYGARKTWRELRRRGVEAGRDQVARVMRQHGIEGKLRGARKRTTIPDEAAIERARDLLQRYFAASAPNEKWVCDITYLRTWTWIRPICREIVFVHLTGVNDFQETFGA
jgi:transposase-like protein